MKTKVVNQLTQQEADQLIEKQPASYRHIWCSSTICGCLGCVNKACGIVFQGVTREQWQDWVNRNPKPEIPQYNSLILEQALSKVFDIK